VKQDLIGTELGDGIKVRICATSSLRRSRNGIIVDSGNVLVYFYESYDGNGTQLEIS